MEQLQATGVGYSERSVLELHQPPEVIKAKEHQQQHKTTTRTKRKKFKCKSHGNMYRR